MGNPFETKTVPEKQSVADDPLKPDAELHVLVGGPYTIDGEEHRYGHTAIRIKTKTTDLTYDFGRYARVMGTFGEEGEGILRVWSNFDKYIASENVLGRVTTDFTYAIFDHQAQTVIDFYKKLTDSAKRRTELDRGRPEVNSYQLPTNYTALNYNCTTLSLDATRTVFPNFENGSSSYIRPEDVLDWKERMAMKTLGGGTPTHLFLPANLQQFLSAKPPVPPTSVKTYGGKK